VQAVIEVAAVINPVNPRVGLEVGKRAGQAGADGRVRLGREGDTGGVIRIRPVAATVKGAAVIGSQ
jgi:hypothetical protein